MSLISLVIYFKFFGPTTVDACLFSFVARRCVGQGLL